MKDAPHGPPGPEGITIMSRPLSEKELSVFSTPATGNGKYPWDEWTSGKAFAAKQGEDFAGKPESFRYVLRAQAAKRNLTVDIRTLESGEIAFRFAAKPAGAPATTDGKTAK
jgi:hypothetical protein